MKTFQLKTYTHNICDSISVNDRMSTTGAFKVEC